MIVIDMDLPSCCKECPFAMEAGLACVAFNKGKSDTHFITGEIYDAGLKPDWCPILGNVLILEKIGEK